MKQLTPEVLREAVKVIKKGWVKRQMRKPLNGHYGYCALGAIMQARINVGDVKTFRRLPTKINERLVDIYSEYRKKEMPLSYRGGSVVAFNDHDETKKEDVIAFLRFAANEQKKKERKKSNSL